MPLCIVQQFVHRIEDAQDVIVSCQVQVHHADISLWTPRSCHTGSYLGDSYTAVAAAVTCDKHEWPLDNLLSDTCYHGVAYRPSILNNSELCGRAPSVRPAAPTFWISQLVWSPVQLRDRSTGGYGPVIGEELCSP